MDKQIRDKLLNILKMQNVCCNGNECGRCDYDGDNCVEERLADTLIESGLIIPKNAVVLTREEYEKYKKQDLFMKDYTIVEVLENETNKARKETAEKFAERLKELVAERNCNEDYDWEDVQVDGQIFVECVDEICKEITGAGK